MEFYDDEMNVLYEWNAPNKYGEQSPLNYSPLTIELDDEQELIGVYGVKDLRSHPIFCGDFTSFGFVVKQKKRE